MTVEYGSANPETVILLFPVTVLFLGLVIEGEAGMPVPVPTSTLMVA